MDTTVILTCLLIIFARVADVALGTVRTVNVIQGRRGIAWILGMFEMLIWVFAVSTVIENLQDPLYAISYALGFATGNLLGMALESWIALGNQVVQVFTREGRKIATQLRSEGFRVTSFPGEGRDGPIDMLFIEVPRKKTRDITLFVRNIDKHAFYTIADVRDKPLPYVHLQPPTGWRATSKKK